MDGILLERIFMDLKLICIMYGESVNRVPTQVLQSLIKSYIRFSVCKAL